MESGDLKALLDPKLEEDFDVDQMHKMVLAASLCVSQSTRLRPKASQVPKYDFRVTHLIFLVHMIHRLDAFSFNNSDSILNLKFITCAVSWSTVPFYASNAVACYFNEKHDQKFCFDLSLLCLINM